MPSPRRQIAFTISGRAYAALCRLQEAMGQAQRPCRLAKVPQAAVVEHLLLAADPASFAQEEPDKP